MSHQLEPPDGSDYLDPDEVTAAFEAEFAYVVADNQRGQLVIDEMIEQLEQFHAPAEFIEVQRAARDRAVSVTVADSPVDEKAEPESYLWFIVKPDDGIFIGYASPKHEESSRSLLQRCATALGYEIHEIS